MMSNRGFTLVEILVTLTLMAILAAVVMPLVQVSSQRNKEQELKLALRDIRNAIDAYKQATEEGRILKSMDASGYPPNLRILVEGVSNLKDPRGGKLYFLRRIPIDPMIDNNQISSIPSWGMRSYRSEANNPQEGEDVYDVYSLSSKIGLNGRPYREW